MYHGARLHSFIQHNDMLQRVPNNVFQATHNHMSTAIVGRKTPSCSVIHTCNRCNRSTVLRIWWRDAEAALLPAAMQSDHDFIALNKTINSQGGYGFASMWVVCSHVGRRRILYHQVKLRQRSHRALDSSFCGPLPDKIWSKSSSDLGLESFEEGGVRMWYM